MNISISSDKALHDATHAFVRAIRGPKIERFLSRTYGTSVDMVAIILELQNPKRTLRHHTRFFKEQRCLYYHVVLSDELELGEERQMFEAIAATILAVLQKSYRKIAGEDFDGSTFQAELTAYFQDCITKISGHDHVI